MLIMPFHFFYVYYLYLYILIILPIKHEMEQLNILSSVKLSQENISCFVFALQRSGTCRQVKLQEWKYCTIIGQMFKIITVSCWAKSSPMINKEFEFKTDARHETLLVFAFSLFYNVYEFKRFSFRK